MPKPGYYAVSKGRVPGVYVTWDECKSQVDGFTGAKYKKFTSMTEAEEFVGASATAISSTSTTPRYPTQSAMPVPRTPYRPQPGTLMGKRTAPVIYPDEEGFDVVYSDGACKGNGQAGSVAGVGVWWGHGDPRNIAERCPGSQTNNRAELIAIVRVLETTPFSKKPLMIKSDSTYSIKCMDEWLPGWERRGWRSSNGQPIKNKPLIRYLSALLALRVARGQKVKLKYVKGHAGIVGNEGADAMANEGTLLPEEEERDWDAERARVEMIIERGAEITNEAGAEANADVEEDSEEEEPEVADKAVQVEVAFDSDDEELWQKCGSADLDLDLDAYDVNLGAPPAPLRTAQTQSITLSQNRELLQRQAQGRSQTRTSSSSARTATSYSAFGDKHGRAAEKSLRPSCKCGVCDVCDSNYYYDVILDPEELEAELREAGGV